MDIRSTTIELLLTNLFGGVKAIHNSTYMPWLNNKRINKYKNYTLQKDNGELIYFEDGKPVIWNNLDSEEQMELIKYRNMHKNGEKLNEKLENIITKSNDEKFQDKIMENINENVDALLYFTDKSKYLSDENKIDIITEMISKKLEQSEEISTLLFDFIYNLTKKDIEKLQKIKNLILTSSQIAIMGNKLLNFKYKNGENINILPELDTGYYFPYLLGDNILKDIDSSIRWDDIQNFAMRGLYTSTSMQRYLNCKQVGLEFYHIFYYGNDKYLLDSKGKDLKGNIFNITSLGKEIFNALPNLIMEDKEDYVEQLNTKNLLPAKLINITDKGESEIIDIINEN